MGTYDFDTSSIQPVDQDFQPLPAGNYLMEIEFCDVRDTKTENSEGKPKGEQLHVEFQILETPTGERSSRKIFENHMIQHENATATEIGRGKIAELGKAIGLDSFTLKDTSQFRNKVLRAELKIKKGNNGYADSNEVARYMAYQNTEARKPPSTGAIKDDIPF